MSTQQKVFGTVMYGGWALGFLNLECGFGNDIVLGIAFAMSIGGLIAGVLSS